MSRSRLVILVLLPVVALSGCASRGQRLQGSGAAASVAADLPRSAAIDSLFAIQIDEMTLALQAAAPSSPRGRHTWSRYQEMFEDARRFLPILAHDPAIKWVEVPHDERSTSTAELSFPELLRWAEASRSDPRPDGYADVFDAFSGHWRGYWRQRAGASESPRSAFFEHVWAPVERKAPGSPIVLQKVILAPSLEQAGVRPDEAVAINAVDAGSGRIVGAVGVRDAGEWGECSRPHVGFFAGDAGLIWVAEEYGDDAAIRYSIFFERVRREGVRTLYTILGCDFSWDRERGSVVSPVDVKGGRYVAVVDGEPPPPDPSMTRGQPRFASTRFVSRRPVSASGRE